MSNNSYTPFAGRIGVPVPTRVLHARVRRRWQRYDLTTYSSPKRERNGTFSARATSRNLRSERFRNPRSMPDM